jgi:hypothetical protein
MFASESAACESASSELICVYPGCKSSGRVFKRSHELERHKLIHFPNKKLICPIHECKQKKKGKSHTRNDKFREHIAAHGELALFCCPIPNCKSVRVKNAEFASHVANDHTILERYQIKSFLKILRIGCDKGRWACPFLCDFSATRRWDVNNHLAKHDLIERVTIKSSIDLLGYNIDTGRATCPICNIQVCNVVGHITNLYRHLETSHDTNEMIPNGDKIAQLLSPWCLLYFGLSYPKLAQFISDFKPTQVDLSTLPPPISRLSSIEHSSRSSEAPTNLENVLSAANIDGDADAKNSSSDGFDELPTQQVWTPHWTKPQQSIVFPETDVTGDNLPTGELAMYGQSGMAQQNLAPPQTFLQPRGLIPRQDFSEPQPFLQPQGFMIPQTFMSAGVSQNVPVMSTFIPPFIFQGMNFWQPLQSDPSRMGWNQYHSYGQNQWSLLPNMNGYGVENHQQGLSSFVPFPNSQPNEMGFSYHPEFDQ